MAHSLSSLNKSMSLFESTARGGWSSSTAGGDITPALASCARECRAREDLVWMETMATLLRQRQGVFESVGWEVSRK